MAEIKATIIATFQKKAAAKAAAVVKLRPAASARAKAVKVKAEPLKICDGRGARDMPPCPSADDVPTDYKTARIYQSQSKHTFRITCERGNFKTKKTSKWEGGKPILKIWNAALKKVDEYVKQ